MLLHSSGSSSRQWSGLIELLSPRYDVRAVDLHGHGAQPAWPDRQPLALADEVTLVEPILREAGPVHLVGHSCGGVVALKVAELHPQSVRSLVAYEPVLFRWLFDADPDSDAAREVIEVAEGDTPGTARPQLSQGRSAVCRLLVRYRSLGRDA